MFNFGNRSGSNININGRSITIKNGRVVVDGVDVTDLVEKGVADGNITKTGNIIELHVHGSVTNLESEGNVSVQGDVGDISVSGGDVTISGNVADISAAGGDVSVSGNVEGDISASGGDITVGGNVRGDISTVGRVIHHTR